MLLELKDLEFSCGAYSIRLGESLIEVSDVLGPWRSQASFTSDSTQIAFWVESDAAECALNDLISLISDLQEDGDEDALKMKITI